MSRAVEFIDAALALKTESRRVGDGPARDSPISLVFQVPVKRNEEQRGGHAEHEECENGGDTSAAPALLLGSHGSMMAFPVGLRT